MRPKTNALPSSLLQSYPFVNTSPLKFSKSFSATQLTPEQKNKSSFPDWSLCYVDMYTSFDERQGERVVKFFHPFLPSRQTLRLLFQEEKEASSAPFVAYYDYLAMYTRIYLRHLLS